MLRRCGSICCAGRRGARFDFGNLFFGEFPFAAAHDAFGLASRARTDDSPGNGWQAQTPGDGGFARRTSMAGSDDPEASAVARFRDSFGSRNSASRLRQSPGERLAARSRVIPPASRPEPSGE